MNLKQKLIEFRDSLISLAYTGSRNYEFNGSFENHPIGDQDIYRLYYVNYHRINEYEGCSADNIGMIDFPLKPFKLPEGMSREDGFKVLSYLTDNVEKQKDVEPFSLNSVSTKDAFTPTIFKSSFAALAPTIVGLSRSDSGSTLMA